MSSAETRRQITWMMFALDELLPGVICRDTTCPSAFYSQVPHMANDGGNHPHPYGLISTPTHEWKRKSWWQRRRNAKHAAARSGKGVTDSGSTK